MYYLGRPLCDISSPSTILRFAIFGCQFLVYFVAFVYYLSKVNNAINTWVRSIMAYNNLSFIFLAANAFMHHILKDEYKDDAEGKELIWYVTTFVEFTLLQSMVLTFVLVMLKLRKIQIILDPGNTVADDVLSQIRRFICISRTILMLVFFYVVITIFFFCAYVFLEDEFNLEVWVPIGFACFWYLLAFVMSCYFTTMGITFHRNLKQ